MNKNLKLRAIVWEIIVPIVLYYIVSKYDVLYFCVHRTHSFDTHMISADNICGNYNTIYVFCKL